MTRPPRRFPVRTLMDQAEEGQNVTVTGWVRNKRISKNIGFLELNDGSTLANLQLVFKPDVLGPEAAEPVEKGCSLIEAPQ